MDTIYSRHGSYASGCQAQRGQSAMPVIGQAGSPLRRPGKTAPRKAITQSSPQQRLNQALATTYAVRDGTLHIGPTDHGFAAVDPAACGTGDRGTLLVSITADPAAWLSPQDASGA
jgi:hypothetical protein